MLVKVDKFIFLVNFVVLEMEEDIEVSIILGKPFLAIGQALIDVKRGELVKFNLTKIVRFADDNKETYMRVDV